MLNIRNAKDMAKLCLSRQRLRQLATISSSVGSASDFQKQWQQAKPMSEIPYPSSLSMIRNFLPGGRYQNLDSPAFMLALQKDYGDITILPGMFGKKSFVVTYNPQDFEQVLRNEGIWPNRPGMELLDYYRSVLKKDFYEGVEGLLTSTGEKWGKFRTAVNPIMMQPRNVESYKHKMSQVNREFVDRIRAIRDPQTLEVPATFEEEINRWTLESVSVVALDKQLGLLSHNRNDPTAKRLFDALMELFTFGYEFETKPSAWKYVATPLYKKLVKSLDVIQQITAAYIDEALIRIEAAKKSGAPPKAEHEKSVLEKLSEIDAKVAKVMATDMLMAGVDTTSTTFVSLLLCLAKNPEKQAKLREEVLRLLPEKDSEYSEDVFRKMPYLKACLKESQRYYPLAVGNVRVNQQDVVLSGYRVPAGTNVFMCTASINMDDNHYPRAKEYIPERWLRESEPNSQANLKPSNAFVFLPFGFGPRSCIGRRIVEMEIELGIARLIRNFHVEFNHSVEKPFRGGQINMPNIPLLFKFIDVKS